MQTQLVSFVEGLRENSGIRGLDEAATKQGVVLKLLSLLGWDAFDIDEVVPEYSVGNRRVDYCLRVNRLNKVFVEVKRIDEDLDKHQEQLLNYSFQEGIKLSILTNGVTWWFYLPLHEGNWEQRKFYTIDVFQQASVGIASKFVSFLSKENVSTGKAVENADAVFEGQQRTKMLKQTIPRAWNRIVETPDDILLDLVGETAENLCGFKVESEHIQRFLVEHKDQLVVAEVPLAPRDTAPLRHVGTTKPERYSIRKAFWQQLLDRARQKTNLHAQRAATDSNWVGVGARMRGLTYDYNIRKHDGGVELYIDHGSAKENERILESLLSHKTEIERDFGEPLEWDALEGRRYCRIGKTVRIGGYRDQDQWEDVQIALIEAMARLESALKSHISALER